MTMHNVFLVYIQLMKGVLCSVKVQRAKCKLTREPVCEQGQLLQGTQLAELRRYRACTRFREVSDEGPLDVYTKTNKYLIETSLRDG